MQRLRPLTEQECYLRCYGWARGDETVKVLPTGARKHEDTPHAVAERIRRLFEARLDARGAEAA